MLVKKGMYDGFNESINRKTYMPGPKCSGFFMPDDKPLAGKISRRIRSSDHSANVWRVHLPHNQRIVSYKSILKTWPPINTIRQFIVTRIICVLFVEGKSGNPGLRPRCTLLTQTRRRTLTYSFGTKDIISWQDTARLFRPGPLPTAY